MHRAKLEALQRQMLQETEELKQGHTAKKQMLVGRSLPLYLARATHHPPQHTRR